MRRLTQKEQNAKIEIEKQDVESCNVLQEIKALDPEIYRKVKFCQCKNPSLDKLVVEIVCQKWCSEHMGKSEQVLVSKETDAKDDENLVKTLGTIMDSSDNLTKFVCDSYQALKAF